MTIPKTTLVKIPAPLREGVKQIFTTTAALRPEFLPPPPPLPEGVTDAVTLFAADPASVCLAPDEAVLQSYLHFCSDETPATLAAFVAAGTALAARVDACLHAMKQRGESVIPPTDPPVDESLASILARWQQEWRIVRRWWELWSVGSTSGGRPPTAVEVLVSPDAPCLSVDQRRAVDRLVAIWRARQDEGAARNLPRNLLTHWSHPMLVGPTGSGKAFAAEELARRLGLALRRWEIGAWSTVSNRSGRATVDLIGQFCADHPAGAVIYLTDLDALSSTRLGEGVDGNTSWWGSVTAEVESFLDETSRRKSQKCDDFCPPFVVLGAHFSELWGETAVGGANGAQAWRLADDDALAEPMAVAEWIARHGGLVAGVARRINPFPLVINRPRREEAVTLAARIMAAMPAALDGVLAADALAAALQSQMGWRDVNHLIEQGLIDDSP